MKRSDRLNHVREQFVAQRKQLAERVAVARARLEEAVRRLEEVQIYRHEYANDFLRRAAAGIGSVGMQDHQAFLARLDDAVHYQNQAVGRAAAELEFERKRWQDATLQVRAVEALGERWRSQESRQASRREQRDMDDLAQRTRVRYAGDTKR